MTSPKPYGRQRVLSYQSLDMVCSKRNTYLCTMSVCRDKTSLVLPFFDARL